MTVKKKLSQLIKKHGLAKVAFAGMCSEATVRQCANTNRNITPGRMALIQYRLGDPKVWKTKDGKQFAK